MQLAFVLFGFLLATGETPTSYKGEVELPVDLYTKDHVLFSAGHCDLEVRYRNEVYSLLLSPRNKTEAPIEVSGTRMEGHKLSESDQIIPVVGTILMRASTTMQEANKPLPPQIAPALSRLDWKATLRMYRSSDLSGKEIVLLFQTESANQKRDLVSFRLFLKP